MSSSDPFKSDFSISKCTTRFSDPNLVRSLPDSAFDIEATKKSSGGGSLICLESDNESAGDIREIEMTEREHVLSAFDFGENAVHDECFMEYANSKRDWAQVKKELQEERGTVRSVTRDREHTLQNAMKQVEELGTQLADSLRAVASAESRAAVAEARCSNLEAILKDSRDKAILKETLASEKSVLGKLKDEAERKYNEVNEQNKILHNRLEALHIKIAERERHSAGTGSLTVESQGEHDLQSVVSYLRRSKEIAETEISLLKQEKLRLQSQLEGAMKASETAQSQLSTERANSRALLFSDEDFKSLQIQVREINLLRESNLQLREENKHNFEECQKLRELAQKTRVEMDQLEAILKERNIEVDSCRNEIERRKMEKLNLENRINELLGACKNIDVDEYNRMKDDCQQMQVKLKAIEAELNETKKLMLEKQDIITCLEQELSNTRVELAEREKTIKASLAAQEALQKDVKEKNRIGQIFKRKFEKEKEDSSKEKITLSQQLEEARQSKRQMVDVSVEQTLIKEKESRIQTLEKALEKRMEEVKKLKDEQGKEKLKRVRNEKTVEELWKKANDLCKKANEDKTQVLEEFEKCKKLKEAHPEGGASSHTSETDNLVASYVQTLENLEEAVSAFGALTQAQASETPSAPAPQAVTQSLPSRTTSTAGLSQAKTSDQREKPASSLKPTPVESRKPGRRFVRPNLTSARAQEPSGDTDMAELDGGTNTESKKGLPAAPARKRLASSQGQESREDSQDMGSVQAVPPVSKKLKSEQAQESADIPPQVPPASKKAKIEQPEGSIERPPQSVVEVQPSDELSQEAATDNSTITDLEEDPKEPIVDANETPSTELLDASEEDEEQDPEQNAVETESDREEGELPSDMVDELDVPASPAVDEEIDEALETLDEKMEAGEGVEETGEESDNNDDDDQIVADPEKSPRGAVGSDPTDPEKSPKNSGSSDPTDPEKSPKNSGSSDPTDPEKSPRGAGSSDPTDQVAPVVEVEAPVVELEDQPVERKTRRTINLSEKALENSEKRKMGIVESSSTTASTPSAPTPTEGGRATPLRRVARGVGRGVVRGRGTTPRGGRRQA